MRRALLVLPLVLSLSGCNWLVHLSGLNKDADKAIGASCRQVGLSLADCFIRNPDADKSAVYTGWREMQEYMSKQNLPTMKPPVQPRPLQASAPVASAGGLDASSGGNKDPEVQAVLDTLNSRPGGGKPAAGNAPDNQPPPKLD